MLKFFRHIRQGLLHDNKISKYFFYAIGEIILVMIGILLALQVNNWNNRRIERVKEQAILKNLQVDFQNNINNLEVAYNSFDQAYLASVNLLNIIQDKDEINPDKVDQLIDEIINKTMSYDPITGSINEIINTGSIHLIRDPALRKQISNWSYYYSDTEDDIIIYRNYLFDFFIPSLTNRVRLRNMSVPEFFEDDLELVSIPGSNFEPNYETTIRTKEFENEVYNNTLNYMYVLNSYKVFKNYLSDTLKLVESNINDKS